MIPWSDLLGNPYLQKLDLSMLLKEGLVISKFCKLKNEPRRMAVSVSRKVLYDHTYVLAKLQHDVLQPLNCKSLAEVQAYLDKAELNQKGAS